jgi:hypothetical protein
MGQDWDWSQDTFGNLSDRLHPSIPHLTQIGDAAIMQETFDWELENVAQPMPMGLAYRNLSDEYTLNTVSGANSFHLCSKGVPQSVVLPSDPLNAPPSTQATIDEAGPSSYHLEAPGGMVHSVSMKQGIRSIWRCDRAECNERTFRVRSAWQ